MAEEKCPTIGSMGVTSGTWMISDDDSLVCLETGTYIRSVLTTKTLLDIRISRSNSEDRELILWEFDNAEDCDKKFDWLKGFLMGSKP